LVVSNPFHEFPQELALRFSAPLTTEKHGNSTSVFYPDDEIARDVAALLTLLLRRLVTVATKTREVHPRAAEGDIEALLDLPIPLVKSLSPVHWEHKPSTVIHRFGEPPEITDYNPRPLGVNVGQLRAVLTGLPAMPLAECVVLSARLYSLALTQLEHDIDLTYQLLIAAVETTAQVALKEYRPDDDQMVANKEPVAKLARSFGLGESEARQLAIEACKGISWASRKFSKFLVDNCTDDIWSEDDVFRISRQFVPSRNEFESAIGQIYTARGRLTHAGRSFPASSVLGIGPMVPAKAIMSFDWSTKPFPPVVWFERVVNSAFRGFINRTLPSRSGTGEEANGQRA
jgi:hypothetical protein